jgi:hypothetical protein
LLLIQFFCLFIRPVKLLCLSNGGGLSGSRFLRIIMKPLLNVRRQLGKMDFGNTALGLSAKRPLPCRLTGFVFWNNVRHLNPTARITGGLA